MMNWKSFKLHWFIWVIFLISEIKLHFDNIGFPYMAHERFKDVSHAFFQAHCSRSGVINPVDFIIHEGDGKWRKNSLLKHKNNQHSVFEFQQYRWCCSWRQLWGHKYQNVSVTELHCSSITVAIFHTVTHSYKVTCMEQILI